jgi:hypothetical protein
MMGRRGVLAALREPVVCAAVKDKGEEAGDEHRIDD